MEQNKFSELCKSAKPISVKCDNYGDIEIVFDNGISVEIGNTTSYDSSEFTFESNLEFEERNKQYQERQEAEKLRRIEFDKAKELLKSKFSPEQWDVIDKFFIFNPSGQSSSLFESINLEAGAMVKSMAGKYGSENYTSMLNLLNINPDNEQ